MTRCPIWSAFGLAPALVMYTWSLSSLRDFGPLWGKLGWAAAFVYAACAALRLARFNTQVGVADKRYFQGLASPAAAAVCMSFVWSVEKFGLSGSELCFVTPVIAVTVGLLMVSRFRYFSFKSLPMGDRQRVPFVWMVVRQCCCWLCWSWIRHECCSWASRSICCPGRYGRSGGWPPIDAVHGATSNESVHAPAGQVLVIALVFCERWA
jgi:phosphatidylserine synthase